MISQILPKSIVVYTTKAIQVIHLGKKLGVSAAAIEQFYRALDNATPNPSEKSGILRILPHYCKQFQPKVVSLGLPQPLTELYSAQNWKLSASDLEKKCDAVFNDH